MAARRQFGRNGAQRRFRPSAPQLPRQRDYIGTQLGMALAALALAGRALFALAGAAQLGEP